MAAPNPPAVTLGTYVETPASLPYPEPGTYAARILNRKLTHLCERPSTRLTDMKVLCLGQPRTGTTSLRMALYKLGYNDVYHMINLHECNVGEPEFWYRAYSWKVSGKGRPVSEAEWDQVLGYCEATVDIPPAAFPEDLMAMYPDAKIILSVRDGPQAWAKSIRDTLGYARELGTFHERGFWQDLFVAIAPLPIWPRVLRLALEDTMGPTNAYFDAHATELYEEHIEHIRRLGREQGRVVFEFNVKDGWGPLCKFLDKDVPDEEFPRANDTDQWRQRASKMAEINKKNMKTKIRQRLIQGAEVVGVVGAVFFLWQRYGPSRR